MSDWKAVITWPIANAAAKALVRKHSGVTGDIDFDSSCWVQSLFCKIGFLRCRKASSKVDIYQKLLEKRLNDFFCIKSLQK